MLIPPKYILTPRISRLLSSIEASKAVIESIIIPPEAEINIRRRSTLKSSLFSARIEGSTLTLDEVSTKSSKDQKKVEVFNILKALNSLQQKRSKDLTIQTILDLHAIVMEGLIENSKRGKFRQEVSAIFNSAGIAVYMPPPPRSIPSLIEKLLKYIKGQKELFVPIHACLVHYVFEKIHPFLDGNGRIGRLVFQSVLYKRRYGMKGLLTIEEYLDNHRSEYYRALEESERDVTGFVEFMLEALASTAEQAKKMVLEKKEVKAEDYLLPRRTEILNIVKDHRLINFDQVRRRFMAVNERTLRYDLKKLVDAGFIKKLGTTKGVYYEAK